MVRLASTDEDLRLCHPVMRELRPHHDDAERFVAQVRRQMDRHGYGLAFVEEDGRAVACAGFRVGECLAWGRFLYVDDLVTLPGVRSKGHGRELLAWLDAHARAAGCGQLHLDSGVHRGDAHRFYFRERLVVSSFHFSRPLAREDA